MMTEKEQESDQPAQQTKPESEGEKREDKTSVLEKKFQTVESDVLAKERKRLEVLRDSLDKKVEEYKKLVDQAEIEGKALQFIGKTEEEKATEEAKAYLKGTGLEDMI